MAYDKKSFLAGLAVGRTLKGWELNAIGGGGYDKYPAYILITKLPDQIVYEDRNRIELDGIIVHAYYEDGTDWGEIPVEELRYSPSVVFWEGPETITVTVSWPREGDGQILTCEYEVTISLTHGEFAVEAVGQIFLYVTGRGITIDWGDGTEELISRASNSKRSHQYNDTNAHVVRCYGVSEVYPAYVNDSAQNTGLVRVLTSLPSPGYTVTQVNYKFQNCINLVSVPADLFVNMPDIEEMNHTFHGCNSLTTIPPELFAHTPKLTSVFFCFAHCISVASIPAGLFADTPQILNVNYCFQDCTAVESIPAGLFSGLPSLSSAAGCFWGSGLLSIPADIFDYNQNLSRVDRCFSYCQKAAGPAPELWNRSSPIQQYAYCFYLCSRLSNYSSIPSGWK